MIKTTYGIYRKKKGGSIYLAKVESYREDGKVKQSVLKYVGKEENWVAVQKIGINKIEVQNVKQYTGVSLLHQLALEPKLYYLVGKP